MLSLLKELIQRLGLATQNMIGALGRYTLMNQRAFYWMFQKPFRWQLLFKQLYFVGNQSFLIVFLSSLFTGAVLGLQIGKIFGIFKAEGLMGAATGKSLALELAPVMCGFIVTGRAGAAMASEIATMKVNEQIDAMEVMGVDPISYLVVPRILASVLMMPLLYILFLFIGIIGAFIIGKALFDIDPYVFSQQLKWLVWLSDVRKGLFKSFVFGFLFSSICCYKGYFARGGAKGVGEATTQSVVASLLAILIMDFFISLVQLT
jgi:phospholipid/cholesterol/gamma-HCH transport system permease protein